VLTFTNPGPDSWDPWQLSFDSDWPVDPNSVWAGAYNEELSSDDGDGHYHHVFNAKSWEPAALLPGASTHVEFTINGSPASDPTNVMANGEALTQIDQGPGVSIGDATTTEGDSGTHTVNLTASLTEAAGASAIHVAYAVVAGTATEGVDYTAASNGTLVFAPGEKTKTIPVTIIGDTVEEGEETVLVFIAGVDGEALPRITNNRATLTITGDDWTPSITTTAAIVKEHDSGPRTATIKVRLDRAPKAGENIAVSYRTVDGTATGGVDYVTKSGTLNFAAGQTEKSLSFTVNGDTDDERLELFRVEFHDPADCLLGDEFATIQIIDDDTTGSLGDQRIVAYVYGGGALPGAFEVTHINYAFSNLSSSGHWNFSGNLGGMKSLRNQNPNLKLLVSIGGWGWSENFSGVAADPAKRTTFAQSAVDLIKSQDLDGVDIDWEWPAAAGEGDTPGAPEDKHNFTLLMQETRDALDALEAETGKHYLLSAFTGAGAAQMAGLEMAQIGQLFDYINVQGYDLHGPWDGTTGHASGLHHNPADPGGANLNIESALKIYADAGIPKDKLLVGVAFYGRRMWTTSAENHGLFQPCGWSGDTPLYKDIVSGGGTGAFRYFWDGVAKVPWLFQDSNKAFVTFDDPRSCCEKAEFSRANGYGGTYFWQMGGDTSDHQLTTALPDSAAAPPSTDADGDGMDDTWERNHFGNTTTAGPDTDSDRDGRSDLAEFMAGTNPKNGADFLRIGSLERSPGGHRLSWNAVAGKSYDVDYSPDLSPDSWITVATGLTDGSFTDTDAGRMGRNNGFYRIRVGE
jgi:chitinase